MSEEMIKRINELARIKGNWPDPGTRTGTKTTISPIY